MVEINSEEQNEVKRMKRAKDSLRHIWDIIKHWNYRGPITLPTKVRLVKAMVFPVVMYACESWTIVMRNTGLEEAQAGIKIPGRNYQ